MMAISYFIGQKYYPIPYNIKKILLYVFLGLFLYLISLPFEPLNNYDWLGYAYQTFLLITYVLIVYFKEIRKEKIVIS